MNGLKKMFVIFTQSQINTLLVINCKNYQYKYRITNGMIFKK